ncbi:DegT/DnrJ/EryC1/StrS family aminotransferase [Paraburkholderia ferrariae]|uniref:DegT/DnrJ/EryC1/StrS family aminotransferase n=1 Tax=Paraburkholderia ferrariae TaxID=386056 RepID=UPI0004805735|nr:DegT/DnrJ/EryC1/StrS family aminotransferase [Paraburkholderia ferrariae]
MAKQLFVPTYRIDECLQEIRQCLEIGWTGLGYKTVEFEKAWKEYTGFQHCHFVNSATAGLHLAVKVLKERFGWEDGDEVISTPLTFVSTNHAILYENLSVVFADVDEYLCLDPQDVERRITPRTRAVMFVGMAGSSGAYREILALCRKHGLALIVDAAHMAGTRLEGKAVGLEADATVFSFQAVKNLPTADSGMVCFARAQDDELARKLSWLGINKDTYSRSNSKEAYKWHYDVEHVGYKYHGNSIMAAIGLVQLRYLDADNAYRRQICQWYEEAFAGNDLIGMVPLPRGCESSRHIFPILVDDRDSMILALNQSEVFPGVHYRDNTHYSMYRSGSGTCPRAREKSERLFSLPLHLRLTRSDVQYIAEKVTSYVNSKVPA